MQHELKRGGGTAYLATESRKGGEGSITSLLLLSQNEAHADGNSIQLPLLQLWTQDRFCYSRHLKLHGQKYYQVLNALSKKPDCNEKNSLYFIVVYYALL